MHLNFIANGIFSPQSFALTHCVVRNNTVCRIKNILCTAVILLKSYHLSAFKGVFKRKDIFNCSTSEFVNTLVVITYNADVAVFCGEHTYKFILHLVCILILINHYVFKLILIKFEYIGTFLKKLHSLAEHIVKVHCISGF